MTEVTKVWITKYALTGGIRECELVRFVGGPGTKLAVVVKWEGGLNGTAMFFGSEYSNTKEEAVSDAMEKRARKVMSLQKQIRKLEAMTF